MNMKLLANENIPLASSEYLKSLGYDIVHIGLIEPSITDEAVMQLAIEQNRVILTFDRDYGMLVFQKGFCPPGVIYLRLENYSPIFPGEFIHRLLASNTHTILARFTVASENHIRQRKIEQT